jgi:hypothetical protein
MMVHELLGGIVVDENVSDVWFTAPCALGMVPLHVPRPAPMKFWAAATVRTFAGKASVNVTFVSATEFGLVSVKVIVEHPALGQGDVAPTTEFGENDLAIVGATSTLR